jgi:hypothetical protein
MKPSEILLARLRDELKLPIGRANFIQRTYAGASQKSYGAWTWCLAGPENDGYRGRLGSQYPVTELIHYARLTVYHDSVYDVHILPSDDLKLR